MPRTPAHVAAVFVALALFTAIAQAQSGSKAKRKEVKDVELKALLSIRGKLLFSDDFSPESFKKHWRQGAGVWEVRDEALRVADKPGEDHHPYATHRLPLSDAVIQFRFRFENARTIFVGLDRKGAHVARVVIQPNGFRIQRTVGIGKTTKSTVVDRVAHNFKPGRWYTLLWEIRGKEMVAQVDNRCIALGAIEGVEVDKLQIQLMSNQGAAWYDALRIWEAKENPKWPKARAKLARAKRSPCR